MFNVSEYEATAKESTMAMDELKAGNLFNQELIENPHASRPFLDKDKRACIKKFLLNGEVEVVHAPWRQAKWTEADWEPLATRTLRQEIEQAERVKFNTSDCLAEEMMLMFQATPDVVRLVIGLKPMLVQWNGPDELKGLAIIVPQIRGDINNNVGIVMTKK